MPGQGFIGTLTTRAGPHLDAGHVLQKSYAMSRRSEETVMSKDSEEDLNDPGNEDPGSLMDDAEVPLKEPDNAADPGSGEHQD